jgi:alpha-ketoglutarate-dependent taurine dioxygenase
MNMASRFQPLSPRIGARAVMSRPELMEPAFAAECLEALERYGVLVFPALGLSDEDQIVFSGRLGDVIPMGGKRADGSRDPIFKVSLDPKHNEAAEYLKGTIYWHIDGATEDVPARATMLSARRISAVGGQTEFCNSYAAYDDLPESEKPHYESLRIGHSLEAANRLTTPNPTEKDLAIWRARGGVKEHPLVWRHTTGRKSLVLGATAGYVAGLSSEDSRALLAKLEAHATRREIVYRHEWQLGDLVIWDNCGTMHRVTPYDPSSGRMMHRTTLHGVEAIA